MVNTVCDRGRLLWNRHHTLPRAILSAKSRLRMGNVALEHQGRYRGDMERLGRDYRPSATTLQKRSCRNAQPKVETRSNGETRGDKRRGSHRGKGMERKYPKEGGTGRRGRNSCSYGSINEKENRGDNGWKCAMEKSKRNCDYQHDQSSV